MVLPQCIKVTGITTKPPDPSKLTIQEGCVSFNKPFFRECVKQKKLVEVGWMRRNILHVVIETGEIDQLSLILQMMHNEGVLADFLNQRCNGSYGIPVIIQGTDTVNNRFIWVFGEMERINFLGLASGKIMKTSDMLHVFCSGRNELRNVDKMGALEKVPVVVVSDTSPLTLAIIKGYGPMVDLLLEYGASIRMRDAYGNQPEMLASGSGQLDLVLKLKAKGASLQSVNTQLKSTFTVAKENGHNDVENFIFFHFSYLRGSITIWSRLLAAAIVTFQVPVDAIHLQPNQSLKDYYLVKAEILRQEISLFLKTFAPQVINIHNPRDHAERHRVRQDQQENHGTSCSELAWILAVEHIIPVSRWIDIDLPLEHKAGMDMESNIFRIVCGLNDGVNTFIKTLEDN